MAVQRNEDGITTISIYDFLRLISHEQYLEFLEGQLEENRVLCVQGMEGVGVTTTLALFAKRNGSHVPRISTTSWSRYLLNPKAIVSSYPSRWK